MTATFRGLAESASAGVEVSAKLANCEAVIAPRDPPSRLLKKSAEGALVFIGLA
jgi:hypothetical protein